MPFLRRVSVETSRAGARHLFPERASEAPSRPVSFAGSASTRTEDGSLERKRFSLLTTNASTVAVSNKSHALIKTSFAKGACARVYPFVIVAHAEQPSSVESARRPQSQGSSVKTVDYSATPTASTERSHRAIPSNRQQRRQDSANCPPRLPQTRRPRWAKLSSTTAPG